MLKLPRIHLKRRSLYKRNSRVYAEMHLKPD